MLRHRSALRGCVVLFTVVGGCNAANPPPAAIGHFAQTVESRAPAPSPAPDAMVWIPGGEFSMGADDPRAEPEGGPDPLADARPIHRVRVDGFWMDRTEVTNAQFARFVAATGYVTVAERTPSATDFPSAPPQNLVAGSVVFAAPAHRLALDDHYRWWRYVHGANWRHPLGPDSDISGRDRYPVVQIAFEDAEAYARWAHKRLPSEAEFEFAARGGLAGRKYAWGDELTPGGAIHGQYLSRPFPRFGSG